MKNIVVGLELNHVDSYILNYLKRTYAFLAPTDITFFKIHNDELPEDIAKKFPELAQEIDAHYVKEMVNETNNLQQLLIYHNFLQLAMKVKISQLHY